MGNQQKKILLVGGGTGGHVVPVFEVYKELKRYDNNLDITIVGSGTDIERRFYAVADQYKIIQSGKLRRHFTLKNIGEISRFIVGCFQAFWLLIAEKPTVIFSKGGYVALPVLVAARILKIPYLVHESDTEIGIVNKYTSKWAKKIFVGFPVGQYKNLPQDKTVYSGQILRDDLLKNRSIDKAEVFGFEDNRPVVLVTGGSQGSLHINKNLTKIIPELLKKYDIIHQTGSYSYGWVELFRDSLDFTLRNHYFVAEFLMVEGGRDRMLEAIEIADLVIARVGANTLSELAVKGKAMILIPWKNASANHQEKNARLLEEAGGALVITDDQLNANSLLGKIDELMKDKEKLRAMSNRAREFFPRNGLEVVTKAIIDELNCRDGKNV